METTVLPTTFEFDQAKMDLIQGSFTKRFKFRLLTMRILPMGFLAGLRVDQLTKETCKASVKYKWLNKNPFRSTFWAVLGMAAEMSSGALIMLYTYGQKPSIATLVVGQEGKFYKKAVGRTTFVCDSGKEIEAAVRQTAATGEPVTVVCPMKGIDETGEVIAEFSFIWSLKARLKK